MQLTILRPKGRYLPRDYAPLRSVRGEPIGEVPVAPALLVDVVARELRASAKQPIDEVLDAIERAGEIFAARSLAGQTKADYVSAVNQVAGLPHAVIERAVGELTLAMRAIRSVVEAQLPRGMGALRARGSDLPDRGGPGIGAELTASTRWIPKGTILGVIASSNHPGTHVGWLQGLALGYKVMIKPGSRDPFTPYRLALALLEAGLAPSMIAFVPGEHRISEHLVGCSDRALVFGSEDAVRRLGGHAHIVARGPGYSKIIAARDSTLSTDAVAASVARSVSGDAGVKCTNASGFISDREDFDAIVGSVVARMATLLARPLGDPEAMLPVFAIDEARRLRAVVGAFAERASLDELGAGAKDAVIDFGDGSGALRPMALACSRLAPEVLGLELPFPALWLARVDDVGKVDDFGATLVMGYMGRDERFHQRLMDDPRIGKVISGTVPTYCSHPLLPHDGFLAHSLMVAKASIHSLQS